MKPDISVVIPCYNEEGNVDKVYHNIKNNLPEDIGRHELIFVNDGSTDGTKGELQNLKQLDPHIEIVNLQINSGYGKAVRAGFDIARHAYIFYIDGDGQYDFSYAEGMLRQMLLEGLDIVGAYRQKREDPFYRKIVASAGNFFCKVIFKINSKAIDCGFKALKKEAIKKMKLKSRSGLLFGLEIYLKGKRNNLRIKQTPIAHLKRKWGYPKGISKRQILLACRDLSNLLRR